jgi:hypothetical protein
LQGDKDEAGEVHKPGFRIACGVHERFLG